MQLPRWNNCKNPRTRGKTAQPSISHSGQGLEGKKSSSLPVEGGIFSLTFPFIDPVEGGIFSLTFPFIDPVEGGIFSLTFPFIDQAFALTIRESLSSGPMR